MKVVKILGKWFGGFISVLGVLLVVSAMGASVTGGGSGGETVDALAIAWPLGIGALTLGLCVHWLSRQEISGRLSSIVVGLLARLSIGLSLVVLAYLVTQRLRTDYYDFIESIPAMLSVHVVADRVETYHKQHGTWPTALSEVRSPEEDAEFRDRWYQRAIELVRDGDGVFVRWYGRDGEPGGKGADADTVMRLPRDEPR